MLIISNYALGFLLSSKTLVKVYKQIIVWNELKILHHISNPVTRLTEELKYKNKSTVSRALKTLEFYNFIYREDGRIYISDIIKYIIA